MNGHSGGRLVSLGRLRHLTPLLSRGVAQLVATAVMAILALGMTGSTATAQNTAVQVSAGGYHTCALLASGRVKCWGYNLYGQLGLGDTVNRGDVPGQMGSALPQIFIPAHGPIVQVATGGYHTCVLDSAAEMRCWGYNVYGQLGYGNTNNLGDNPSEVFGGMNAMLLEVRKIAAGEYHTCALRLDGSVYCWGYNAYGQLGTGDTQNRRDGVNNAFGIPALGTGRRAIDIATGGYHTCALLDDSSIKCWGYNGVGTLGLGDSIWRGDNPGEMGDALPVVNVGLTGWGIKQLVTGRYHNCAVRGNNSWPKCWGYNIYGQLGLGDTNNRGDNPGEMAGSLPFLPGGSMTWLVALGGYHSCASTPSGSVARHRIQCWGYNFYGQLGLGDQANRGDNPGEVQFNQPAAVDLGVEPGSSAVHRVIHFAAGGYHTCAVLGDGSVKCWGYNAQGQLGLGDTDTRGTDPAQMGDALPVVDL